MGVKQNIDKDIEKRVCSVKVWFETLGCRLNQIESEATAKYFIDEGFNVCADGVTSATSEDSSTVLVIINTCTVTQKAEQKARRIIRLCLKKFPNAVVLVTGCYAQLAKEAICGLGDRVAVVGGQIKSRIVDIPLMLKEALEGTDTEDKLFATESMRVWNPINFVSIINEKIVKFPQYKAAFPENSFKLATSSFIAHSRASLKIQDGCNNNCSYCAIHMARGHSVSIDVDTAIDRVVELEKSGHEEVVLTTVNIGQYRGLYNGRYLNFSQLLIKLLENTSTINFRISSLYPEIVDEEFCTAISDKRVRPHFHLSVQSGSDKILKSMNRNYVAADVIRACDLIRTVKPDAFLACDIITGFPGEEDSDFEATMSLCRRCDFAWVHGFPYSERPGTEAAVMKHKVPQSVSGERCRELIAWAKSNKIKYIEGFIGKTVPAIIETVRRPAVIAGGVLSGAGVMAAGSNKGVDTGSQNVIYHGVTENFLHCEIHSSEKLEAGKTVIVEILKPLEERIENGGEIEALAGIVL